MIRLILIIGFFFSLWFTPNEEASWDAQSSVGDVLIALGDSAPQHARPNATEEEIKRGYDLVYKGKTVGPNGKKSSYISKYFACTSCHNQVQEDPNLMEYDPAIRLDYLSEKNEKFLQGSTFYGIANRESWYGGDYFIKYGELVTKARNSLAESTQLCAKVCSSGRYLEDWELESILAYYWSIQYKLEDLKLNEEEVKQILSALNSTEKNSNLIDLIKSKYMLSFPVKFGDLPQRMDLGYDYEGDKEKGKLIYELSCQSCHQKGGVSTVLLPADKPTMNKFLNHMTNNTDYNLYQIIRKGTYTDKGKPRYMPLNPKEKLSDQQIEDLRAYIEYIAKD